MLPEILARAIGRVRLRVRAQRALEGAATLSLAGLGAAAVALVLAKLDLVGDPDARLLIGLAVVLPILGAIAGALRPITRLAAARMIDRTHPTRGRIAAALELAGGERTAWAETAIADAEAHGRDIRPALAAPLRAPRDLATALGVGCAVALLAALEIPVRVVTPVARGITPVVLHADDLDALDERLRDVLAQDDVAPEVREEAQALNRVIEDLADRRIDRAETLRRLAEIEARIDERRPSDASLLRDDLRAMGQELRRAEVAERLAEALRDADAASAEAAMRELAERTRADPPSRQELERLREAMEAAAREREDRSAESEREHEEETERLLQRRREQGASEPEQQRLLEQRRRELDRLRREHEQQREARRRLDRLRREMEEAARELGGDAEQREQASESMERAAEDLSRMARQQMSEEQMQELSRQLEELREMVRRQREQQAGQDGEGQQRRERGSGEGQSPSRMDRFVLRARGQGDGEGMPIGVPGGQGEQGRAGEDGEPVGEGRAGEQGEPGGEGTRGSASGGEQTGGQGGGPGGGPGGGEEQQGLVLGQGGTAQLEIPGLGGSGGGPGEDGAGGSGEPGGPSGGAGDQHAPATLDDPTRLGGAQRTVQVEGEQRRGPTRSEVIRSASQRGFASRAYRDVYSEYADHAEEVIERDRVPPGYRFYVQRYFQLIRPRAGAEE